MGLLVILILPFFILAKIANESDVGDYMNKHFFLTLLIAIVIMAVIYEIAIDVFCKEYVDRQMDENYALKAIYLGVFLIYVFFFSELIQQKFILDGFLPHVCLFIVLCISDIVYMINKYSELMSITKTIFDLICAQLSAMVFAIKCLLVFVVLANYIIIPVFSVLLFAI